VLEKRFSAPAVNVLPKQIPKKWTVLSFYTLLNNRKSLKWKKC
jgi:fibronectin type 3 domain-containing protein